MAADGFNLAGDVTPGPCDLESAKREEYATHERVSQRAGVNGIERSRVNSYQHLVVPGRWFLKVLDVEDICGTGAAIDDGFHWRPSHAALV